MNRVVFAAVVALLAVATGAAAQSVQEVVLGAKPAVALVTARVDAEVTVNCGAVPTTVKTAPFVETGTGWFVDGRGFLVTNAHVVDPAHTLPPWVVHELRKSGIELACVAPVLTERRLVPGARPDIEEALRRRVDPMRVGVKAVPSVSVLLANGTMLRADVAKFSPPLRLDTAGTPLPESGRDLALLRVAPGVYPSLVIGNAMPRITERVHIIGFPGVVLSHELLGRGAAMEASVTNGFVSGFKPDALGQDVIQTDAAAAHGNSGGPAIGARGDVVGVLTFVTLAGAGGSIVQGFNFLIPARDVRKFLEGTEVATPAPSAFDEAWRAGLADLFGGSYRSAAARLGEANRLVAGLPDVKRALAEAENPPPTPWPWGWIALGVALVAALGYGGFFYRRWQRNRFRIKASEVARMLERGENPVLIDVRKGAAQSASTLRIPGAITFTQEALERGETPPGAARDRVVVAYCS